jgi:tetratricopeptide (TPR) repeat protein
MWIKSLLIDRQDWTGREALLKRAVAARSLDCGCEHHQYGAMLLNVGRIAEAVEQLRQASDMLALYVYTPWTLADALIAAGKPEEAKPVFESVIDLAPDAEFAGQVAAAEASQAGDIAALLDPKLPIAPAQRDALVKGFRASASQNAGARAEAIRALVALPEDQQTRAIAMLLGRLGANREAFALARRIVMERGGNPSIFWNRSMRGTLSDPGFPKIAQQLGLIDYWKASHTKPDACKEGTPPPFCGKI